MPCDVEGCAVEAVAILAFRGIPGHVHVCGPHERVDREWCDVVASAPMPCPIGCESADNVIATGTPPLL